MLAALAVAVLSVPLTGGRLSRLSAVRFRWPWLPVVALLVQVLVLQALTLSTTLSAVLHAASYVPIAVFVVANLRYPGLMVLAAGLAANTAAIVANDGVMPASAWAAERAGLEAEDTFENSAVVDDARLPWLGDVFYVPEGWPLANVFSVGDVLIVAGAAVFMHRGARRSATVASPAPG